jgi:hypothetical protein
MQQDGVAVGLRTRGFGCTDHAASAAEVFDDDRLTQSFLHRILENARSCVVGTAGRERHQHGDGAIGIGLCRSDACRKARSNNRHRERVYKLHDNSPALLSLSSAPAD